MELRVESHQHVDVLRVVGRLDLVSSSTLKDAIRQRLSDHRSALVLNLEKVDFINSSGLGALLSALKDVRLSGGRLVLCHLTPYADEIFALTGLKQILDTYETQDEAVASFASTATPTGGLPRARTARG
ncbi:MAG: STAS domain-containing protein [Candidatus Zixiibacteriota bacterium]